MTIAEMKKLANDLAFGARLEAELFSEGCKKPEKFVDQTNWEPDGEGFWKFKTGKRRVTDATMQRWLGSGGSPEALPIEKRDGFYRDKSNPGTWVQVGQQGLGSGGGTAAKPTNQTPEPAKKIGSAGKPKSQKEIDSKKRNEAQAKDSAAKALSTIQKPTPQDMKELPKVLQQIGNDSVTGQMANAIKSGSSGGFIQWVKNATGKMKEYIGSRLMKVAVKLKGMYSAYRESAAPKIIKNLLILSAGAAIVATPFVFPVVGQALKGMAISAARQLFLTSFLGLDPATATVINLQ